MDIAVTVNFWFLVSLCLVFALVGVIIGARVAGGYRHRY
jgi:hypothetical protein